MKTNIVLNLNMVQPFFGLCNHPKRSRPKGSERKQKSKFSKKTKLSHLRTNVPKLSQIEPFLGSLGCPEFLDYTHRQKDIVRL